MATTFTYFGGMCVLVEREDGFKTLFDPYIRENPATDADIEQFFDVDLIVVTHAAFDHNADTAFLLQNSNATLLCGGDVARIVKKEMELPPERVLVTIYGDERIFGQSTLRTVYAMHNSVSRPEGVSVCSPPLGFVMQVEPGTTYYHTGDTFLYTDMKMLRELYKPNVMVVGISKICEPYPCEMTPREAACAVSWVGADVVIPSHYPVGSPALGEFMTHVASFAPSAIVREAVGKPFVYHPFQVSWGK